MLTFFLPLVYFFKYTDNGDYLRRPSPFNIMIDICFRELQGGLFKSHHCFEFLFDGFGSLTSPCGCVCKEIANDVIG